ncbi:MAG TPA: amidohydrolase [Candidatus Cybelea sp.]|nr:amidohydrolase [Candidatus Cybelea sp.]
MPMKTFQLRVVLRPLTLFLFAFSLAQAQSRVVEPADIIIVHGRVYTENPKQPWAQAVAIYRGKIVAVGEDPEIESRRGMGTKVINAGGKLVLPGFADCHIHFIDGSLSLGRVNLEGALDPADIQKRLREYAAGHPGDDWILGRGWNYAMFGAETLPHKKYLDEIFPNRPVFLEGYDGHTYWANSKALLMAGIKGDTADPPNGVIVRDSQTGEATGALKEAAQDLVAKIVPKPTRDDKLLALRAGMKWANKNGLTRVHSAGGDFELLDLFNEMRHRGDLTLRMYIAYFLNPPELRPQDRDAIEHAHGKFHDEWIDASAVKFMLDGVVESHTAAMLEPYGDDPSLKGKLFWDPAKYKSAVAELDKRGSQLFTHAIGDLGVRTALDAYEEAETRNRKHDRRPRIEHIETIAASDIPRFGKLAVIASMQPLHSYPDADTLEVWARNAGADRASRAWAWKSIADAGGHLCFGSDWPVVTLNPWEGIQTAVTRQTLESKPEGGFVPEQRLTVAAAIDAYTLGAAFAGRREKSEGSLEIGKLADLIIVSQNVFDIPPRRIAATKVITTIVGGRLVYQADAK